MRGFPSGTWSTNFTVQQQLLQVAEGLAVGGAVNIAQLSTKWALQLLQYRVGQSTDAVQAEHMAAGKVLGSALTLPCWSEHLKANLALQQVALDLSQDPLRAPGALTS